MYSLNDNIVALATAPGSSALSVVRCSGPQVLFFLKKIIFKKKLTSPKTVSLCSIFNPVNKKQIDQCLVVFFKGPNSFTGDDVVEFSLHGGSVISSKIIQVLTDLGCREASPGEFTYRAFINGKIDLIQAEAINSLIKTSKDVNAFYASKNVEGFLSKSLVECQKKLKELITYIEHELDFTEEEIGHVSVENYLLQTTKIIKEAKKIERSSFVGSEQNTDLEVCIAGKPNAGKSSLFNRLVGKNRSIVTSASGTTRDFISASFVVDGFLVDLVDTAGLRVSSDKVEKQGIDRALSKIKQSDIILFVSEENPLKDFKSFNFSLNPSQKTLFIQNKTDINKKNKNTSVFNVSCKTKKGLRKLQTELSTLIKAQKESFYIKNKYLISSRAQKGLSSFIKSLKTAHKNLKNNRDLVVFVSSLYVAQESIQGTINPTNKSEIINNIFKGFCVGK